MFEKQQLVLLINFYFRNFFLIFEVGLKVLIYRNVFCKTRKVNVWDVFQKKLFLEN